MDDVQFFLFLGGELRIVLHITHIPLKRLDVDDHNLDLVADGKLSYLRQILGVVDKIVKRNIIVQAHQMITHQFDGGQDAFANGD